MSSFTIITILLVFVTGYYPFTSIFNRAIYAEMREVWYRKHPPELPNSCPCPGCVKWTREHPDNQEHPDYEERHRMAHRAALLAMTAGVVWPLLLIAVIVVHSADKLSGHLEAETLRTYHGTDLRNSKYAPPELPSGEKPHGTKRS